MVILAIINNRDEELGALGPGPEIYKSIDPIWCMASSKWRLFEYEYSLAEFILCFVVLFFVSYFILVDLYTALAFPTVLAVSAGVAVVLGLIWTYIRVSGLFKTPAKGKR
jgi:hypothetical protein